VVDGDPAGRTLAALDRPGVLALAAGPERPPQQNAGAAVASGDNLLFLRPDTRLPVGRCRPWPTPWPGRPMPAPSRGRPRASSRLAAPGRRRHPPDPVVGLASGDQAIFVRRDRFQAVGGFPDIPDLEDLAFMRALVRSGARVRLQSRPVVLPVRRGRGKASAGPSGGAWSDGGRLLRTADPDRSV